MKTYRVELTVVERYEVQANSEDGALTKIHDVEPFDEDIVDTEIEIL